MKDYLQSKFEGVAWRDSEVRMDYSPQIYCETVIRAFDSLGLKIECCPHCHDSEYIGPGHDLIHEKVDKVYYTLCCTCQNYMGEQGFKSYSGINQEFWPVLYAAYKKGV